METPMANPLSAATRVVRQLRGEPVDRLPLMGGWFHGVPNLAALAGLSVEAYLADPVGNLIRANRALGVDCMIHPLVPTAPDQIRSSHVVDEAHRDCEPEHLQRDAEALPASEAGVLAALNLAQIEHDYRHVISGWLRAMGDIVYIPTFWEAVPEFMLYSRYGYEAYLSAIALYPDSVGRLYWQSAVEARARNTILARLFQELALAPVLFTGQDICDNAGPMCSLPFLRRHYFPLERYALAPLIDAGIRVVRHCDGNIMPMVEDCLQVGYAGFQGFQYECGVDLFSLARHKAADGRRLLFFAGLNVTRTLPFGTLDDVRAEIDYVVDATDGGQGLFFFTSSSIGPEVPLANVRFAYDYAARLSPAARPPDSPPRPRSWPWQRPPHNQARL